METEPLPCLSWSPNGGTTVATLIAQWTLLVSQRRHNGSREADDAHICNGANFLRGDEWSIPVHPFGDHGDAGY